MNKCRDLLVFAANQAFRSVRALVLCSPILFAFGTQSFAAEGPKLKFADTTYDFDKIPAGQIIRHTFFFTNTGDQMLEIKDVRPSCGCTTAGEWDRQLQPGKSGGIPVRFNSTEYTGPIHKTVIVVSNDPSETNLILHIQGRIWRPIEVTPENVTFLASSDARTNDTKVVKILNNLEQPLSISTPECTNNAFKTALKTIRPGKEFELAISLLPQPKPVNLWAPVTLKTSSTNLPLLTVMARAVVQSPVTAMPSSINLPGRPLANRLEFPVVIRNNAVGPLALSEPSVVAGPSPDSESMTPLAGAEAHVKEVQAGRMFVLTATFPAGFHIEPKQSVELRVKTNHPSFPVFKIAVQQGRSLEESLTDSGDTRTAYQETPSPSPTQNLQR